MLLCTTTETLHSLDDSIRDNSLTRDLMIVRSAAPDRGRGSVGTHMNTASTVATSVRSVRLASEPNVSATRSASAGGDRNRILDTLWSKMP